MLHRRRRLGPYQSMRLFHVGALQPSDDRDPKMHALDHGDETLGDGVASYDTAEDVDKDRGHLGIAGDERKGLLDCLCSRTATNVCNPSDQSPGRPRTTEDQNAPRKLAG